MKKDLRKDQDRRVRAHPSPTSGPLQAWESWAERLGLARRAGWGPGGRQRRSSRPGDRKTLPSVSLLLRGYPLAVI